MSVWVSCDGTVVSRTSVGKLELSRTDINTVGCLGKKVEGVTPVTQSAQSSTGETTAIEDEVATPVIENTVTNIRPDEIEGTGANQVRVVYQAVELKYGPRDTTLLDLSQTDTVRYRLERMRQNQIRYANAIRSVRMRQAQNKKSQTVSYLARNEAVVTNGTETGWILAQRADVSVVDTGSNIVVADTVGKTQGYITASYLRNPNPSDLVRINQADNAYWSDVTHVNATRYLNLRAHPWLGAPIVSVLSRDTILYVISTIDDWSEVISDNRMIQGYVKSKYLTTDRAQRVEQLPVVK